MLSFVFGILGGTALLMYGVDLMGEGLENMSSSMMKTLLEKFTGKLWKAFLAGIFLTAVVQSSTAISVLSVGFVNSGIMKLSQAIGIIYGANIGTTITAQFMALSLSFNIIQLALPIITTGYLVKFFSKTSKQENIGQGVLGVGFLLLGLLLLNEGIPYMRENPAIQGFFEHYASNIFLGILLGTFTTALVHSSSATVGIVILLGNAGLIDLRTAVILMLGDNIGTSITALIASIKGNVNAKRTALGHALHNVIGVLMALPFLSLFVTFIEYFTTNIQGTTSIQVMIANSHTIFNIVVALIFLPLNTYFVKLLLFLIKEPIDKEQVATYLDPLLLATPVASFSAAAKHLQDTLSTLAFATKDAFETSALKEYLKIHPSPLDIKAMESQKSLSLYMIALSKRPLTDAQSIMIPGFVKAAKYTESLGHLTEHLFTLTCQREKKQLLFTDEALAELHHLQQSLLSLYKCAGEAIENPKALDLRKAEVEVQALLLDLSLYGNEHIHRLERGQCTLEASLNYLEILATIERITQDLYRLLRLSRYELQGRKAPSNSILSKQKTLC